MKETFSYFSIKIRKNFIWLLLCLIVCFIYNNCSVHQDFCWAFQSPDLVGSIPMSSSPHCGIEVYLQQNFWCIILRPQNMNTGWFFCFIRHLLSVGTDAVDCAQPSRKHCSPLVASILSKSWWDAQSHTRNCQSFGRFEYPNHHYAHFPHSF